MSVHARVAIVEDEDVVRELLATILADRGYDVRAFATITEAQEGLRDDLPDLLITDVELPDGCGLDLVGTLESGSGRKVPTIVLSSLRSEHDFARGYAAGAVDYLSKPLNREELLAKCAIHLARAAGPTSRVARASLPEKDQLAFGRYRVVKEVGRGGYGRVYLAKDLSRKEALVALKVLVAPPEETDEAKLRFIRETYTLASVTHENLPAIYDVGSSQGWLYYAMEHVQGELLSERVIVRGPIDEPGAIGLARGLLSALRAMDAVGLVHRDVKPVNVILRDGRLDGPVLIDFGLAKRRIDRGITAPDLIVGTTGYMPPEVIRGFDASHRGDLFSLGLTVRYALAGEEIFPLLRGMELLEAMMKEPIPPPPGALSPEFTAFLASLVQNDPKDRPANAEAALAALESCPNGKTSPERREQGRG